MVIDNVTDSHRMPYEPISTGRNGTEWNETDEADDAVRRRGGPRGEVRLQHLPDVGAREKREAAVVRLRHQGARHRRGNLQRGESRVESPANGRS